MTRESIWFELDPLSATALDIVRLLKAIEPKKVKA